MKFNYTNILLFALPLNILLTLFHVYNQRNHKRTTPNHTQTNRSLCECKLYLPENYDSDPQMKKVMENFNKQTQQRLRDYDDRMIEKRMQCKDKCDKEIQKIILKDKLERQMAQQLTTLETKIGTDDIPTCICEKSLADKMEKVCLKCAQNLGGIVAPSSGVLAGIAEGALYAWKPTALKAAIAAAQKAGDAAGVAAGEAAGKKAVILALKYYEVHNLFPGIYDAFVKTPHYADIKKFSGAIVSEHAEKCQSLDLMVTTNPTCETFEFHIGMRIDENTVEAAGQFVPEVLDSVVGDIKEVAEAKAAEVAAAKTAEFKIANVGAVESTYGSCQTAIIASIVAILVIVLVMVIIYLILRYRRKKKMKKKLQYIKLLEE
ncbi:surface antigen [Plasmodium falciparum UGT5.1]|uniref:Surface antigen n=1 Tax=Plasmodium falciparum UGT5.1 TaxID=1237627 RepID=W7J7P6_PLAFA|nr:surface antigen [Plasmodium falciparum UGT5.1]